MKINSPAQIAFFTAGILTAIAVACLLFSYLFVIESDVDWLALGLSGALSFVTSYLVLIYLIEIFIYRKIKLVYKTIYNLKTQKDKGVKIDMKKDVLSAAHQDVLSWAQGKKDEIEKLRDQETFRREFIGNLAHELKTPIFNIQGYILTLLDGGIADDKINIDYLERADRSVEKMINIIEDLDTITKLESGQMAPDIKKINICDLAKEVMKTLEMKAENKKIRLMLKKSDDNPIFVMADKERIAQVLTNLIANSVNYGKEGGKTEIRFYDMDDNILVEIADDGIGIAEEHLSRLFERFYRVDKSRSRHESGTGLGLSIVKHIIDAHKQTVNVRSSEGNGATFSFTLKRAK